MVNIKGEFGNFLFGINNELHPNFEIVENAEFRDISQFKSPDHTTSV